MKARNYFILSLFVAIATLILYFVTIHLDRRYAIDINNRVPLPLR
jgi:hypothetical protein